MAKDRKSNVVPTASEAKEQAKLLSAAATIEEKGATKERGVIETVKDAVSNLLGGDNGDKENGNNDVAEFQSTVKPMAEQEASKPSNAQVAVININSATAEEIANTVPGIGAEMSEKIVEYRNKSRSGFRSLEDLDNVEGISKERVEALAPHIVFTDAEVDTRSEEDKAKEQARIDAANADKDKRSEEEKAAISNTANNITYEPSVKTEEEFRKEVKSVYTAWRNNDEERRTSLFTGLCIMAADMAVLARDKVIGVDLDWSTKASLTESIAKKLPGWLAENEDQTSTPEDFRLLGGSNGSIKQYLPDACRAAGLVLYGVAEVGWYPRGKALGDFKIDVTKLEDMPEAEASGKFFKCIAAPYNTLRPTIRFPAASSGRASDADHYSENPNRDDGLVYLTRKWIGILFEKLANSSNVRQDKDGWLEIKPKERTPATPGSKETGNGTPAGTTGTGGTTPEGAAVSEKQGLRVVRGEFALVGKALMDAKEKLPVHRYAIVLNGLGKHWQRKSVVDGLQKYLSNDPRALAIVATSWLESQKGSDNLFSRNNKDEVFFFNGKDNVKVSLLKEGEYSKGFFGMVEQENEAEDNKAKEPAKEAPKTEGEKPRSEEKADDKVKEPAAA